MTLPGYEWLKEEFASEGGKARLEKVRKLAVLAKEAGLPLAHLALLWCLQNPRVSTVILGASRLDQLTDNLAALDSKGAMTPDLMAAIEHVVQNKPEPAQRF